MYYARRIFQQLINSGEIVRNILFFNKLWRSK